MSRSGGTWPIWRKKSATTSSTRRAHRDRRQRLGIDSEIPPGRSVFRPDGIRAETQAPAVSAREACFGGSDDIMKAVISTIVSAILCGNSAVFGGTMARPQGIQIEVLAGDHGLNSV